MTELVSFLIKSKATQTLFLSMSYSYRAEFIDHILQIKSDLVHELN